MADFDELMELYVPTDTYKETQGTGVYDYEGNKLPALKDEGGTIYYIVEKYAQTTDYVKWISNLKIISSTVLN